MGKIKIIFLFQFLVIFGYNGFTQEGYDKTFMALKAMEQSTFAGKIRGNETRNSDNYDLKYHELNWYVDPDTSFISGSVKSVYKTLSTVFDNICFSLADNMIVDSVYYHNEWIDSTEITHNNNTISIDLPVETHQYVIDSIEVFYHGNPIASGFGSFATSEACGNPVMWTLSEPFGAQGWWPCKQSLDDKIDSIDVIVTTPSQYKVASNGVLISNDIEGSDIIYHWKHKYPIAAYLIAIGIADYTVYSDYVPLGSTDSIEILNYVYSCSASTAQSSTPFSVDAMILFDSLFGLYPFADEKYGHAQFGWGGGMEHQTMSFMGGYSQFLQAHELAHQWFGDKVTCGDWQHIWLNEGWATYCEGMTHEAGIRSNSNWPNWLQSKINNVTGNPNGSVHVPASSATNVGRIFNGRLSYNKGAMLLHMLRWKLGDADFFEAVNNYLEDTDIAFDYAVTYQFQSHLEAVSGLDLTSFFDDWFYGEGWPTYNIVWSQDGSNELTITVNQTQSHPSVSFFDIPIPLKFTDGISDTIIIVDPISSGDEFEVLIDFPATSMIFDPDKWILAKSTVVLPIEIEVFTAIQKNDNILVSWNTLSEENVDRIILEKSVDGFSFNTIATYKTLDHSEIEKEYQYVDKILNNSETVYYYRLKSIDYDGLISYSAVIHILLSTKNSVFHIVPNPITNQFGVEFMSTNAQTIEIEIYNSHAQKLFNKAFQCESGNNVLPVNISKLPSGNYFIKINNGFEVDVKSFIKN